MSRVSGMAADILVALLTRVAVSRRTPGHDRAACVQLTSGNAAQEIFGNQCGGEWYVLAIVGGGRRCLCS